ncbi:hypothetical protein CCMA1212_001023 [Trichoderma ghanense]|uniref:Uncharacterized protein n=1 Tax=Trichoderma ghanense TaxID=65468 RepID=A0ABY2HKS2_9HYPO
MSWLAVGQVAPACERYQQAPTVQLLAPENASAKGWMDICDACRDWLRSPGVLRGSPLGAPRFVPMQLNPRDLSALDVCCVNYLGR